MSRHGRTGSARRGHGRFASRAHDHPVRQTCASHESRLPRPCPSESRSQSFPPAQSLPGSRCHLRSGCKTRPRGRPYTCSHAPGMLGATLARGRAPPGQPAPRVASGRGDSVPRLHLDTRVRPGEDASTCLCSGPFMQKTLFPKLSRFDRTTGWRPHLIPRRKKAVVPGAFPRPAGTGGQPGDWHSARGSSERNLELCDALCRRDSEV